MSSTDEMFRPAVSTHLARGASGIFTRGMNLEKPLALFIAALALAGCRTADETLHPPSELVGALLTVNDVGTDWRETQRDAFDERENENPVIDATQFCAAGASDAAALPDLAGQAGADVEMQRKESSRMLRMQAWSNAEVGEFFDTVEAAAKACDNTEWTDADGVTYSFDVIDGPGIGKEVVHWKVIASPPAGKPEKEFGAAGRTTVARYGDTIMMLEIGDFAPDPAGQMLDEDEWGRIVSAAGDKIDEL